MGKSTPMTTSTNEKVNPRHFSHSDSVYEDTKSGRKFTLFDSNYLCPEYLIDIEYVNQVIKLSVTPVLTNIFSHI